MSIIIRQGAPASAVRRTKRKADTQKQLYRKQGGFTLPELLVSLCILMMVMHGVWQWGIVMQRTADAMAQNQQAVSLAQQVLNGLQPECPEGWLIQVKSVQDGGLLYETEVVIMAGPRQWQFYYAGPEEIIYAAQAEAK